MSHLSHGDFSQNQVHFSDDFKGMIDPVQLPKIHGSFNGLA